MQQLDLLADYGTKSYIVGSTNSLLLQQKDRYSDILINLDDDTINITSASLRSALSLSAADRRWIDFITQAVNDTWDESNPGRPKTMGYVGSEEFIRLQFEEYLLSLISSVKCHNYILNNAQNPRAMLPSVESDPAYDFGMDWIDAWSRSENYLTWEKFTDSHLFDIVEPKHPCAGGLTIDDVQRRIAEQVKEFHLDERFAVGKEVIGRNLMAGREKASTVFSKLYSDMEALRESQRRKQEEQKREAEANNTPASPGHNQNGSKQTVSSKAGSYIGSWGAWVGEKRKTGWGRSTSGTKKDMQYSSAPATPTRFPDEKPSASVTPVTSLDAARPESYQENIFDAESNRQSKRISYAMPSKFHENLDEGPTSAGETPAASIPTPIAEAAEVAPAPLKVSEPESEPEPPVPEPEPVLAKASEPKPEPAPEPVLAKASEPEPEPVPEPVVAKTPESTPRPALAEEEESSPPTSPAAIPDPDPLPPTGWSEPSTPMIGTEKKPEDVAEAVAEAVKATSAEAVSPW